MRAPARLCLWLGMGLALGGCATVSQVPFNASQTQNIRAVAFINIPTPSAASIRNFGSAAALVGGGIGAAVATSASESQNKDPFQQLLAKQNFDFGREMQQALTVQLQKMGYRVTVVQAQRQDPHRLLGDYDNVPTAGADAILDSTNGTYFGYSNVNVTDRRFRPHIHLRIRLVDAKTKKVLYGDEILYGYTNTFMKATQLKAPDKYFYDSGEEVLADGRRSVEGLRDGIAQVANHIAVQLGGGGLRTTR